MKAKLIEVRDAATYMPVLAVRFSPANEAERYMLSRLGYGQTGENQGQYVLYYPMHGGYAATDDPNVWSDRTNAVAHQTIVAQFETLLPGDVVDVEYELRETERKKLPERLEGDR